MGGNGPRLLAFDATRRLGGGPAMITINHDRRGVRRARV